MKQRARWHLSLQPKTFTLINLSILFPQMLIPTYFGWRNNKFKNHHLHSIVQLVDTCVEHVQPTIYIYMWLNIWRVQYHSTIGFLVDEELNIATKSYALYLLLWKKQKQKRSYLIPYLLHAMHRLARHVAVILWVAMKYCLMTCLMIPSWFEYRVFVPSTKIQAPNVGHRFRKFHNLHQNV